MSTNWPFSADYKSRIDNWLKDKEPELLRQTHKLTNILFSEKSFRGKDTFKIPLDRFKRNGLGFGDLELILTSLNSIGVIEIYRRFPNFEAIEPLGLNPRIAQDQNTEVHIFSEELNYLKEKLSGKNKQDNIIHSIEQPSIPDDSRKQSMPPKEWRIEEKEESAYILHNEEIVFRFPRTDSQRYLLFKYLWKHYSQTISYQKLYEVINISYSNKKGERNEANKKFRDTLEKLRRQMKNPFINLQEKRGWRLTISSSE